MNSLPEIIKINNTTPKKIVERLAKKLDKKFTKTDTIGKPSERDMDEK